MSDNQLPELLRPEEFHIEDNWDNFGSFDIPELYELADDGEVNISALEENMRERLYNVYCATWGLNITSQPIKVLLVAARAALFDAAIRMESKSELSEMWMLISDQLSELVEDEDEA